MGLHDDPWYTNVFFPGVPSQCGKQDCQHTATRVGFASPKHRVLTCDIHEDELSAIRQMAKAHGPYTAAHPPVNTASWRRDNRS